MRDPVVPRGGLEAWAPLERGRFASRVGVDIQCVEEVRTSLSIFKDRYLTRVFHEHEITFARSHPYVAARYLAGQFAAREAMLKVLEIEDALSVWRNIFIMCDQSSYRVELFDAASTIARGQGITEIFLSISRNRTSATALALATVDYKLKGGSQ